MKNMVMWDFCCGLKGASLGAKERGWKKIVTLDINPDFKPDLCIDIRDVVNYPSYIERSKYFTPGEPIDLIWFSPPCTEFSREFMPWCKTGREPIEGLSILRACIYLVWYFKPRYWVIENVKGALEWFRPYLGKPRYICNPYYLWGEFPPIDHVRVTSRKEKLSSNREAERALIPFRLSYAIAEAVELQEMIL